MPNFNRNRLNKSVTGTLDWRGRRTSGGKSVELNWKGVGPKIAEYLLLGGGGSGGFGYTGSGGGGGGGIKTGTESLLGPYTISIGGGGTASTAFGQTAGGGGGGGTEGPWGGGYGGGGQGSQWGAPGGGGGVLIVAYPSSDGTLTIGAGVTSSLSIVSRSGYNVYTLTGAGVITA